MKDEILFKFVENELTGDKAIGICNIKFSSLCLNGGDESTHAIFYGQEQVGEVHLISDYVPQCMQQVSFVIGDKQGKVYEELGKYKIQNIKKEQEKNALIKRRHKLIEMIALAK